MGLPYLILNFGMEFESDTIAQEVTKGNRLDFPPVKSIRPYMPQVEEVLS